jgi:hypothetical protein
MPCEIAIGATVAGSTPMIHTEKPLSLLPRQGRARSIRAAIFVAGLLFGMLPAVCNAEASGSEPLRLSMISGDGKRLLATVNGETFAVGEKHRVMIGKSKVGVQCLDIRDGAVVVKVDGDALAKELAFGKRAKWVATPTNALPAQPVQKAVVVEPETVVEGATPVRGERDRRSPLASIVGLGILVLFAGLYFAYCRSCSELCRRAGAPSALLVWVPGLQYFPLFKAAGVSRWWLFVPVANFFATVVCFIRLCETFHVSKVMVVPMLLPLVNWLAFIYLARVSASEEQPPSVRQKFAFEVPNN